MSGVLFALVVLACAIPAGIITHRKVKDSKGTPWGMNADDWAFMMVSIVGAAAAMIMLLIERLLQ